MKNVINYLFIWMCSLGAPSAAFAASAPATGQGHPETQGSGGRSIEFLKQELAKPRSNYVMVVAHRGYWQVAPENSMAAMEKAVEIGVDMVEVDVRQTQDGVLILMHDKTLDRTTNGSGPVADHTWAEISKLRLKTHTGELTEHRIPTFEEAMNYAKGKVLVNIDKGENLFKEIGEVLRKTGTLDIAVPKSGLQVTDIASRMPHIQGSQFMAVISLDKNADPLKKIDDYIARYRPKLMEISFQTEKSAFFKQYDDLLSRGVKIWMTPCAPQWSAGHHDGRALDGDPDGAWGWLLNHGATLLLTDHPKALIEYLEKIGRRDVQPFRGVVAHRAGIYDDPQLPENSIAALREAVRIGANVVEIDVHLAHDGTVVVNHDHDFLGMDIATNAYADLKRVGKLSNGEHLPTLAEYIAEVKRHDGLGLWVDIKRSNVDEAWNVRAGQRVAEVITEAKAEAVAAVIAPMFTTMIKIKMVNPAIKLYYIGVQHSPETLKLLGFDGVNLQHNRYATEYDMQALQEAGMAVGAYVVDDPAMMETLLAKKVDFITTNKPQLLVDLIRQKGQKE